METRKTTGTAEQLAAMTSTLFFNIMNEWDVTDSYLSKFLDASPLKIKSLKRKSAYFNERQMIKATMLLKIYNNVTQIVGETKESKGMKTKKFMQSQFEELSDTPLKLINQSEGLKIVVDFVDTLIYSTTE